MVIALPYILNAVFNKFVFHLVCDPYGIRSAPYLNMRFALIIWFRSPLNAINAHPKLPFAVAITPGRRTQYYCLRSACYTIVYLSASRLPARSNPALNYAKQKRRYLTVVFILVTPTGFEPNKPTFSTRKILDFIAYFKIFVEKLSKKLSPFNVVFIQKRKAYVITLLSALRRMAHFLIKSGRRGRIFNAKRLFRRPPI